MSLHDETETETRADRIDPVLRAAGWGVVEGSRVQREMICPGRIQAGGKRGKGLSCDYVLFHKGQKLAVLEAKRAGLSHRNGVGQAKDYATRLGARFAYASNGLQWYGNIRHIVLMRPIRSMIEFKQIIGRGTRTFEGKDFFTIWDFVKAHRNFSDPEWDGEPEEPVPPGPGPVGPVYPPSDDNGGGGELDEGPSEKIVVRLADGKERAIRYIAATTYWSADGKPISAAEFLRRLFGDLAGLIADEDELRAIWADPDNRQAFLERLDDHGYDRGRLEDVRRLVDAPDSDLFDVFAYVLFANPPRTRRERADGARRGEAFTVDGEMRELLLGILQAYETHGEGELAAAKLGSFLIGRYGSVGESREHLGSLSAVRDAFRRMQSDLYAN